MADIDQDLEELGRQAREAARALEQLSGVRQQAARTNASLDKKEHDAKENNAKVTNDVNKAMRIYEDTIGRNISAAYRGEKAGNQFATAIQQATDAVSLLIAIIPGVRILTKVVGVLATQLLGRFAKETVNVGQKLYDLNQSIGSVGGSLGTSLEDLSQVARRAGYGFEQLDKFGNLIRQNSSGLAMFGGTVAQGTRKFAEFTNPLVYGNLGIRLQNMGLSIDEIRDASARFTKLQSRLGFSQTMTTEELSRSSAGYLENLNLLSRLTGASVDQQQAAQDRLLSQQRFRAAYEDARLSGDTARMAKMQKAMDIYTYYTSIGAEDLAQGVADASTGFIGTSEASMQIYRAVPQIRQILDDANKDALSSTRDISIQAGETAQRFRTFAMAGGDISGTFGDFAQSIDAMRRAEKLTAEDIEKAKREQTVKTGGSIDNFTKATIGLQFELRDKFQGFIEDGIEPATDALKYFTRVMNGLPGMPGPGPTVTTTNVEGASAKIENLAKVENLGLVQKATGIGASDEFKQARSEKVQALRNKNAVEQMKAFFEGTYRRSLENIQDKKNIEEHGYLGRAFEDDVPLTEADKAKAKEQARDKFQNYLDMQIRHQGSWYGDVIEANRDQIGYARGGIVSGPLDGYQATLHGTEAVVPLPDGKEIPVEMKSSAGNRDRELELLASHSQKLDQLINLTSRHLNVSTATRQALS